MVLEISDKVKTSIPSDVYNAMKPAIGKKMVVKNIRELLSTAEGNIGCTQGAETLVF